MRHLTTAELEAGLDEIRRSPAREGTLELIVSRPAPGERALPGEAELDPTVGLVGDNWFSRGSRHTPDGGPHPDMQVALVNARAVALLAQTPDRWALAGDQLYVDVDLGDANLQPGSRLAIGSAVLALTAHPHTGCAKFRARFGADALRFVNSPAGKALHLRGRFARVEQGGTIRVGDRVRTLPGPATGQVGSPTSP